MAFRFRRTMKIAPGVRLNLTKSGASVRVGPRGAGVTTGTSGTTVSAGIPGTGLNFSEKAKRADQPEPRRAETSNANKKMVPRFLVWLLAFVVIGYFAAAIVI